MTKRFYIGAILSITCLFASAIAVEASVDPKNRVYVQAFTSRLNASMLNNEFNLKYENAVSEKMNYEFQVAYLSKDINRNKIRFNQQALAAIGVSYRLENVLFPDFFANRMGLGYGLRHESANNRISHGFYFHFSSTLFSEAAFSIQLDAKYFFLPVEGGTKLALYSMPGWNIGFRL
ncbi:MAG: hypothetical protein ACI9BD_000865 [Candidatus Marinamargulisbacteria bacterium]|jgi:hypothetical protein